VLHIHPGKLQGNNSSQKFLQKRENKNIKYVKKHSISPDFYL
jgi:hypothetical protein